MIQHYRAANFMGLVRKIEHKMRIIEHTYDTEKCQKVANLNLSQLYRVFIATLTLLKMRKNAQNAKKMFKTHSQLHRNAQKTHLCPPKVRAHEARETWRVILSRSI